MAPSAHWHQQPESNATLRAPPASIVGLSDQAKCLHKGPSGLSPGDCPLASKKSKVCLQPALPAQLPLYHSPRLQSLQCGEEKEEGNQVKPDGKAVLLVSLGSWRAGSSPVAAEWLLGQAQPWPGCCDWPTRLCGLDSPQTVAVNQQAKASPTALYTCIVGEPVWALYNICVSMAGLCSTVDSANHRLKC